MKFGTFDYIDNPLSYLLVRFVNGYEKIGVMFKAQSI